MWYNNLSEVRRKAAPGVSFDFINEAMPTVKTLKLREGFYWTGIQDYDLRVFDIIMETEFGTTYNSYILRAGDQTVLFETAKAKFFDDYLDKLKELVDVTAIDYLVVSHTEPDHAGSIEKLLDLSPRMKILSTGCAAGFLKEIVNRDFVSMPVKDGQRMTIGDKTLRFLVAPNLHWPDTMYTFIEEEQILVTCDSFGSHYAHEGVLLSTVENRADYEKALRYYFDCIIGPFKPFMLKALPKVRALDLSMICPGHGPVLDQDIPWMLDTYEKWSTVVNPNPRKTVVIPYVSAYGYTGMLAEKIAQGVADSGEVDVRSYDLVTADPAKVNEEVLFADGILLGTPTIVGEALKPIWDLTTSMFAGTHGGKHAGAFGSYGWSGEGVPNITQRLKQLRMKVVDGYRVRFKPSEADLVGAYEWGYQFGCLVQNKEPVKPKAPGARSLVKCLVCGEIFDSSLEICPVCGVGKENFVPVEVEDTGYHKDSGEFYLILGNGAAGFNAAKAIRERDKTGAITIVSDEPVSAYNRPMLTKAILTGLTAGQIAIEPASWYAEQNICEVLGRKVVSVDAAAKEAVLDDGTKLHFTRLIYALGSECFVPPIPGSDKEQVVAIRRLSDAQKVMALMEQARHAVVIGGGVLGLEAAWELKKGGLEVTVLEAAPVLMGRQLDENAAALLRSISEEQGISIHTAAQIAAIEGEDAVTGVRLADGTVFPAELVIISAGVRANVALAKEMGLEVDRAVVVNEKMETNLPGVYACGDCAQYKGMNYAIWPQAAEEGKVAGACAAGDQVTYAGVSAALTFHGMNTALFSAGDNGKNPNLLYKSVEFMDAGKKQYKKYYFLNNRLCGVILLGDLSEMARLTQALEEQAPFEKVLG